MILTDEEGQNNVEMSNDEIKAEYTSSLADLTFNSKPLINVLTILAEENLANAPDIVAAIEEHLAKVQTDVKLPILYLIDCIAKNIGGTYTQLFSQNIVMTFCSVFKVVEEKTRAEMFKLRQTWNEIFPQKKLYAIDVQINMLDPAWPVTAQPPPNSIHFNPKFLKPSTNSKEKPEIVPLIPEPPSPNMDTETFTMQQKLIQKQKELIELQQKKLELELLQTQVKLQKQLKNNKTISGNNMPQNILLKHEVAKQLMPNSNHSAKNKPSGLTASQRGTGQGTRITPVNSALVAAASKPIRDPRLLRQQTEKSNNGTTNNNSSVLLGSKTTILDSNKVVANKMSVRDSRNEPRLVNNKDNSTSSSQSKPDSSTKSSSNNNKSYQKSSSSNRQIDTTTTIKSTQNKPMRNSKNADTYNTLPSSSISSTLSSSSSSKSSSAVVVSLLDSPTKNKSDKSDNIKSPSKSPSSRHKKKDYNNDKSKSFKDTKRDRDNKSHKIETSPTTFKGVKGSAKNRNYMRRNRSISPEPSQQDVDFRVAVPEKQTRLPNEASEEKSKSSLVQGMDVDLRQLPSMVGKKRLSTENMDQSNPKKTKTEMFDALFGNEDTDLRKQLPVPAERPPTPPPPIISLAENEKEASPTKKTSNLDAIRAKLATATGRDKVMSKSFRKKPSQEDEDLRIPQSSPLPNDNMKKIIISSDDEQCIKAGTMTKEQEKQLMNKIIAQIEHQKLREAQRKESVENLQPVSDEEIEFSEETDGKFGDKDDRVNFPKFGRDPREQLRGRGGVAVGPYWRGGKRRHWDNPHVPPPHPRPGIRPWIHPLGGGGAWRPMGPNFIRPILPDFGGGDFGGNAGGGGGGMEQDGKKSPEVPNDLVVDSVNQDDIKTINIDCVPRDIRYYDESAIVFMNWDDPKEISFQNGTRHVIFDDKEVYLLAFNEPYKELSINGNLHKVRLGAPSREIFIDSKPYECYFGGPGITIDLNGQMTTVKLDGPLPQVKIGNVKRTDLVAGKVNLIIDAKILVPVFLDAKVQKFVIDGETHTLKFVDALKTVLINDVPFNVEFGGLPKPITVHDKKHFIRFSVLPRGIKPGFVNIKDMEGSQMPSNSPIIDENSQDTTSSTMQNYDINEPALPVFNRKKKVDEETDRNSNSPHFFQNFMQQNNLDVLSSVMTSSIAPSTTSGGYQVENIATNIDTSSNPASENVAQVNPVSLLPPSININELFQKLVATGIVATSTKEPDPPNSNASSIVTPATTSSISSTTTLTTSNISTSTTVTTTTNLTAKPIKRNTIENLSPVTFAKPETLKVRQNQLYEILYSGMQCSSCGMRFPPEQSMHYSQHLDWHFRQNRKGKKNIRVAASRRWYYTLSDWKNYEEIEDLEEREKNYFDQQQSQAEGASEEVDEEIEIPSVPADPDIGDAHCDVCRDRFDQFFNEEKEEWHLKNAIRVDDKTYHPVCYEDLLASLAEEQDVSKMEEEELKKDELVEKTEESNIPGLEIVLDDDDDDDEGDELMEKNTETDEVIIEESDESKPSELDKQEDEEDLENNQDEGEDDDVIINEVVPERIEVDDDDDYESAHTALPLQPLPIKVEQVDDGFMDIEEGLLTMKNGSHIKIKTEPIDPDDLPADVEMDMKLDPKPHVDTTRTDLISTIDGNIELSSGIPTTTANVGGKIKINISKPLLVVAPKETKDMHCDSLPSLDPVIDPSQPLPPGEEPPVQLNIKPALRGIELKKLTAVKKGSELTGMCSIM